MTLLSRIDAFYGAEFLMRFPWHLAAFISLSSIILQPAQAIEPSQIDEKTGFLGRMFAGANYADANCPAIVVNRSDLDRIEGLFGFNKLNDAQKEGVKRYASEYTSQMSYGTKESNCEDILFKYGPDGLKFVTQR